jgi:hypothetical protein
MIYNTRVTVVEETEAASPDEAVSRLAGQLIRAGFNVLSDGPQYADAFLSENQPEG